MRAAILFAAVFFLAGPVQAADFASGEENSGSISGYLKAMYVADDRKGGRLNQSTPGFGGKIGGETAAYFGFRLKAAWYTTTDLGLREEDPRKTDLYMFDLDKKPYSLLGEMQISARQGNTALLIGRQEFFSPIINTYDYRIIPNLFDAYTLVNRDIPESTVTLAYVKKMSGLDGLPTFSEFRSMSQQAYTSLKVTAEGAIDAKNGDTLDLSTIVGDRGVWAAGWVYGKDNRFQLWNYYGADTLNTVYVDGRLTRSLSEHFAATLEGQAYQVFAVGGFKNYLAQHGLNASYGLYGVKGSLAYRPAGITAALALNHFTGNPDTVTAFGNWGGYPEFVSMPYMHAENKGTSAIVDSSLSRITVLFDLGVYGLSGQSLLLGHAKINLDENILANSDLKVNTLLYRARINPKLSARVAVDARNSRNSRYDNEFVTLGLRYDF